MSRLSLSVVAAAALVAVMTPAPARAVTFEKLAFLTFSGPVQIPGATLNAGTYRFRLADPDTSRKVIQVLSHDGATTYAMFQTMPDSRTKITPDPVVSFIETPAGVPAAVKSLFWGGEYNGFMFVYPKGFPIMTAEVAPQPEVTYTRAPAPAPEPIAEPEVAPAPEVVAAPEPEPVPEPVAEPAAPPVELPRTAGPVPFVAFGGFATLLAGLGLGLLRKYVN
jgi:hypothetical protein